MLRCGAALVAAATPRCAGAAGPRAGADLVFPVRTDVPDEMAKWMDRYVQVFGVHIFASAKVDAWALQHVARGMAKYLDQDEDGEPDHPDVVRAMVSHKAAQVMTRTESEYDRGWAKVGDRLDSTLAHGVIKNDHPVWNCSVADVWVAAEIFQSEIASDAAQPCGAVPPGPPYGRDDAVWEETFHLITHVGYGCARPDMFGFRADAAHPTGYPTRAAPASTVSRALDAALGACGAAYNHTQTGRASSKCYYHYDDATCRYPCLINEYLHKCHIAATGAGDYQCDGDEYYWCTQAKCQAHDPLCALCGNASVLPQVLPSGHYSPKNTAAVVGAAAL